MNFLSYIFDDKRSEKERLLRLAPVVELPGEITEAYRDIPSDEDGPKESIWDIKNQFPESNLNTFSELDDALHLKDRQYFLEHVDKLPDFQLNQGIVKAAWFFPDLISRNPKKTLSVLLLISYASLHSYLPTLGALGMMLFGLIKTIGALVLFFGGIIGFVLLLVYLGDLVQKGFHKLRASRPGDKALNVLMPKWDKNRNKMVLPEKNS